MKKRIEIIHKNKIQIVIIEKKIKEKKILYTNK